MEHVNPKHVVVSGPYFVTGIDTDAIDRENAAKLAMQDARDDEGFNDIESGRFDDDPSPYDGTYSEE
jgi:hypothetical protein